MLQDFFHRDVNDGFSMVLMTGGYLVEPQKMEVSPGEVCLFKYDKWQKKLGR